MPQLLVPQGTVWGDILQGFLGVPSETGPPPPCPGSNQLNNEPFLTSLPLSHFAALSLLMLGISSPINYAHPAFRETQRKATDP